MRVGARARREDKERVRALNVERGAWATRCVLDPFAQQSAKRFEVSCHGPWPLCERSGQMEQCIVQRINLRRLILAHREKSDFFLKVSNVVSLLFRRFTMSLINMDRQRLAQSLEHRLWPPQRHTARLVTESMAHFCQQRVLRSWP